MTQMHQHHLGDGVPEARHDDRTDHPRAAYRRTNPNRGQEMKRMIPVLALFVVCAGALVWYAMAAPPCPATNDSTIEAPMSWCANLPIDADTCADLGTMAGGVGPNNRVCSKNGGVKSFVLPAGSYANPKPAWKCVNVPINPNGRLVCYDVTVPNPIVPTAPPIPVMGRCYDCTKCVASASGLFGSWECIASAIPCFFDVQLVAAATCAPAPVPNPVGGGNNP